MLDKLKQLFRADEETKIDKKNKILYASFAVVFYHVIDADGVKSLQEKEKFFNFFKNYFELEQDLVLELYNDVVELEGDLDKHLEILKEELQNFPSLKIKLMNELNSIILSDGIDDREYVVFEKVRVGIL